MKPLLCMFLQVRIRKLGLTRFTPRYALSSTIKVCARDCYSIGCAHGEKRLLDHLKEAAFFAAKDLESINNTLESMQKTLRNGEGDYSPHLITLLSNRLHRCRRVLSELKATLADLSPELTPIHEKLVSILRSVSAANTRAKVFNHIAFGV